MAQIDFYIPGADINLNGSGLGLFGSSFGASVNVGEYQQTTFITNSNGTVQGAQGNNVKFLNTNSGIVGSSTSGIWLTQIPNYQSTLNIRFTHGSAVKAQNVKLYLYDRSSINNDPSGVTSKVAEIIHPGLLQSDNTGSGDAAWLTPHGSAVTVTLAPSPGISGLYAGNGSNSTLSTTRHDWFIALAGSPDSVGSKTYAGFVSLEYL